MDNTIRILTQVQCTEFSSSCIVNVGLKELVSVSFMGGVRLKQIMEGEL